MAVDLYELKLDTQRIEELIPLLDKLDYVIELLHVYATPEAIALAELLRDHYAEIKELIDNKLLILLLGGDLLKGSFNGRRKLDIDLSLNKKGIKETKTLIEALTIWQDETTTVYYHQASIEFHDGEIITFKFTNDDNQEIMISSHQELAFQIQKSEAITNKMINTTAVVDEGGRIGHIVRITDTGKFVSNVVRVTLYADQPCLNANFVVKEPSYTWWDTTSVLIILAQVLTLIDKLPEDIEGFYLTLIDIVNNLPHIIAVGENITKIIEIHDHLPQLIEIHDHLEEILELIGLKDKFLLKENNLSDVDDVEAALVNLGLDELVVGD